MSSSILSSVSGSSVDLVKIRRALISVFDKSNLLPLANSLVNAGVEIISTGGTSTFLSANSIPHIPLSSITEFPEILSGRVKSLHPKIHGGILAVRGNFEHEEELKKFQISPIDLIIVNLYPFELASSKENSNYADSIENIDIGGPAMIRSGAKNHSHVTILTSPSHYQEFLEEILNNQECQISYEFRKKRALEAFQLTSHYDRMISEYLEKSMKNEVK